MSKMKSDYIIISMNDERYNAKKCLQTSPLLSLGYSLLKHYNTTSLLYRTPKIMNISRVSNCIELANRQRDYLSM